MSLFPRAGAMCDAARSKEDELAALRILHEKDWSRVALAIEVYTLREQTARLQDELGKQDAEIIVLRGQTAALERLYELVAEAYAGGFIATDCEPFIPDALAAVERSRER